MTTMFPPGPPTLSKNIIKQYLFFREFQKDSLKNIINWFTAYGDTVHFMVGEEFHVYLISNPEHIRDVTVTHADKFNKSLDYTDETRGLARLLGKGLLTSDGEFWKRQRKMIQPAFHTKRITAYADTMVGYTLKMLDNWGDNRTLNIGREMMRLTLNIVAKSLFDADATDEANTIGAALDIFQHAMNGADLVPSWIPTPGHLRMKKAVQDMDDIVYGYIAGWRESHHDKGDLLSMLMLAEDDAGQPMSDKQIRDECVTLLLAGHETTANAMNWTWVLLAQHPEVAEKLHRELDTVLQGQAPTLADLKRLPYTEMVIKESMRLYPPAWSFSRKALDDVPMGDYMVPKGSDVNIINYWTHHDPQWWDEPKAFRPERFSAENEAHILKYTYMPFGGGPRVCVGNSFAMMEAQLLLATIAQRYELHLPFGAKVEREPLITLRPKNGLRMVARLRERVKELA